MEEAFILFIPLAINIMNVLGFEFGIIDSEFRLMRKISAVGVNGKLIDILKNIKSLFMYWLKT